MNKSNRQYQRGLTTNAYNQDFIYYKYSKQLSKSPRFKKHTLSYQQHQIQTNHAKIQSMKNTLNTLFDPLTQGLSKSFNKSVAQLPTQNKRKQDVLKYAKSVYQQSNKNLQLNNKLQTLTSKLRQIAQKPHFTSFDEFKKQKSKKNVCQTSKINQEPYLNNMNLITKKNNVNNDHNKLQEFITKQTNFILQKQKTTKSISNYSQQLMKSKSKSSLNKNQFSNSNSQSSSLKRQAKNLKTDKSVSTFHYPGDNNIQLQITQRPRGKTAINIINTPLNDTQSTKIKINSYIQNKQLARKSSKQYSASAITQRAPTLLASVNLNILQPHRGPINSIIINSDGKRFLSASNDYTIKQSTLDGSYKILRKHNGRVNVLRMIDDKLFSGGNDCKIRFQNGYFSFQSPVLEIYPNQRQNITVGTSSCVELFNIVKNKSIKKIEIKTKWYKLFQKINRDIYFVDNHHLSTVDWRVPFSLINYFKEQDFIENWMSNPNNTDFYQLRNNKLICINNDSNQKIKQCLFNEQIKDYCWRRDKVYILTNNQLQIMQNSRGHLQKKAVYNLNQTNSDPSKIQIKNDLWIYSTLDGTLVVNKFQ